MTLTASPDQTTVIGRVARVTGPVVDIEFPHDSLPDIYNALKTTITIGDESTEITLEVAQHLGDDLVRAIALKPTDGLVRGQEVRDTGGPITVPVGDVTKGKVFNVIGEVLNAEPGEQIEITERWGIHRKAPSFDQLESKTQMFETGIKVIDLLTPVRPRRKDRPVRRRRCRQDRPHPGDDPARRAGPRWCVGVRRCRRAHP